MKTVPEDMTSRTAANVLAWIETFRGDCESGEYTDTSEAWEIIDECERKLKELTQCGHGYYHETHDCPICHK